MCDHAHEICPIFSGKALIAHKGFDDPPRLAAEAATDEERPACCRRVRDEIRQYIESLPEALR